MYFLTYICICMFNYIYILYMHVFFFRYIYKCEGMYVCIYICNFGYADWGTLIEVHPIVSRKLQGVPFVGERLL